MTGPISSAVVGQVSPVADVRVSWADLVVDLRTTQPRQTRLRLPTSLPAPGIKRHRIPIWADGVARHCLPDTSHLPNGGPGGDCSVSVHLSPSTHHSRAGVVFVVCTYPDGFRLASVSDATNRDDTHHRAPGEREFVDWMTSKQDGLGVAFVDDSVATTLAQRAWMARRWYDHVAAIPGGVAHIVEPVSMHKAVTFGFTSPEQFTSMATFRRPESMRFLQEVGFWFSEQRHIEWLLTGPPPLAAMSNESLLWSLYLDGWSSRAYDRWVHQQQGSTWVLAEKFLDETKRWTQIVQKASESLTRRGLGDALADARVGEIASLCIVLGLDLFEIGVMVGEGTFTVEALRTLDALTGPAV